MKVKASKKRLDYSENILQRNSTYLRSKEQANENNKCDAHDSTEASFVDELPLKVESNMETKNIQLR